MNDDSIISMAIMAVGGLIGYGRLNERVKEHQDSIAELKAIPVALARVEERLAGLHVAIERLPCHKKDGACSK